MDTEERKEEILNGKEPDQPQDAVEEAVSAGNEGTEGLPKESEEPKKREAGEQPDEKVSEEQDTGEPQVPGRKPVIRIAAISAAAVAVLAGGFFLVRSLLNRNSSQPLPVDPIISYTAAPSTTLPAGAQDPMLPVDEKSTFYEGVYVDGFSLGGLTKAEALEKILDAQKETVSALDVTVKYGDESTVFSVTPDMVSSDAEEVLDKAMQIGRTGTEDSRIEYIAELSANPVKLTTKISVDPSSLETKVRELAQSLTKEPVNAKLVEFDATKPEDERFVYQEGEPGLKVDGDKLWQEVSKEITDRDDGVVEAVFEETQPEETVESLQGQFTLIKSFTTKLTNEYNRNSNISLACSIINGTILQPGEEFSFNGVVGERTSERGFRSAGVIVGGDRTESGLGGGICQVSGTLFNAVAMSDLEITQRFTHSYELGYLRRGRDATVDYGHKDFCFKNNKTSPIVVVMTVDLKQLTVTAQIYGEPLPNGETIDIEVETTGYIGANTTVSYVPYSKQPRGTTTEVKARSGIKCTSYKIYKDADGNEIRRVKLFDDTYPAIAAKIYYNPKDGDPSKSPSPSPTLSPSPTPDETPEATPTKTGKTAKPTKTPGETVKPTKTPGETVKPTQAPTSEPTQEPTQAPTAEPTKPSETPQPTQAPTAEPPQPTPDPQPEDPGEGGE